MFGPFNEAYGSIVEVLVQPRFMPFCGIIESIKIKVIQNIPRKYINFNKGICRAFYGARVTECTQEPTGEGGFAGTEVAFQIDFQPGRQVARQRCAQRLGGGGLRQVNGKMGR